MTHAYRSWISTTLAVSLIVLTGAPAHAMSSTLRSEKSFDVGRIDATRISEAFRGVSEAEVAWLSAEEMREAQGRLANVAVGVAGGGIAGAATYLSYLAASGGTFSWQQFGAYAAGGAAAGGVASVFGPFGAQAFGSMYLGGIYTGLATGLASRSGD